MMARVCYIDQHGEVHRGARVPIQSAREHARTCNRSHPSTFHWVEMADEDAPAEADAPHLQTPEASMKAATSETALERLRNTCLTLARKLREAQAKVAPAAAAAAEAGADRFCPRHGRASRPIEVPGLRCDCPGSGGDLESEIPRLWG